MKHIYLMRPDLKLFDGAAPAGAAPAGEGAQTAPAEIDSAPGHSRRGKSGKTEKVVYGKQETEEADSNVADAPRNDGISAQNSPDAGGEKEKAEDKKAQFDALITGDMKDLFDERVQGILKRQLEGVKGLEARTEAAKPVLDMLARRYGVEDGDPAKLAKALEEDDAYWEETASKHGMTPAQYLKFMRMERENETFRMERQRQQGQEAAQRQIAAWEQDAQTVKTAYPGFDLAAESRNPQFLGMLKAGIPVQHAYEVLHLGEIKQSAAAQAAQRTEKQVTDTIRAKGARPSENGASGASGIVVKSDASKLTRADRAEIARRAARGEQITF